jgi:Putative transposase of IS4/5 family (DUF4096)
MNHSIHTPYLNPVAPRVNTPYGALPTRVSEESFNRYFLPFLSLPLRGPKPKIPLWQMFNYILYQLHTGCQWHELPIVSDPGTGTREIHYISVWKWFRRWSSDRSLETAFTNSVWILQENKQLRLSRLHGDGTNTIAKKGAILLDILAGSIRKARR